MKRAKLCSQSRRTARTDDDTVQCGKHGYQARSKSKRSRSRYTKTSPNAIRWLPDGTGISVNVQAENLNDLPSLLSPIKEATLTVKGADSQLVNNGESGWEGELSSLTPTQAYKIKMQKDAVLELNGKAAVTNENTITLSKGWNWIGYVSSISQTLEDALQNLQAEKNDVIKGEDSFCRVRRNCLERQPAYTDTGQRIYVLLTSSEIVQLCNW